MTMWLCSPAMISWPRARWRHLGDEVAHRAGGDEQPGLLAEQLRGALLERDDGRVVAEDVVADLGLGHGPAHLGRRLRDGVGAKVDDRHWPARIARMRLLSSAFAARTRGVAAQHASLSRWRSPVRIRSGPPPRPTPSDAPFARPNGASLRSGRVRARPVPSAGGRQVVRAAHPSGVIGSIGSRLRLVLRQPGLGRAVRAPPTPSDLPEVEFVAYSTSERLSGRIRLDAARLTDMLNAHREYVLVDALAERLPEGGSMVVPEILIRRHELALVRVGGPRGDRALRIPTDEAPPRAALRPLPDRGPAAQQRRRGPARRPAPRATRWSRSPTPRSCSASASDIVEEPGGHDRGQSRPRRVGPRGRARRAEPSTCSA